MLPGQRLSAFLALFIFGYKPLQGTWRKCFVATKYLARTPLRFLAVYVRSLIFEVNKEPQFQAWARKCDTNVICPRQFESLGYPGMLIYIEHAPILIICGAPATPSVPKISAPFAGRSLREFERSRVFVWCYLNYYLIPIESVPVS